jgi:hypothetical protein
LLIVSFVVDIPALTILRALNLTRFPLADLAVSARLIFHLLNTVLVCSQAFRLARSQLARADTFFDVALLVGLALVYACAAFRWETAPIQHPAALRQQVQ